MYRRAEVCESKGAARERSPSARTEAHTQRARPQAVHQARYALRQLQQEQQREAGGAEAGDALDTMAAPTGKAKGKATVSKAVPPVGHDEVRAKRRVCVGDSEPDSRGACVARAQPSGEPQAMEEEEDLDAAEREAATGRETAAVGEAAAARATRRSRGAPSKPRSR